MQARVLLAMQARVGFGGTDILSQNTPEIATAKLVPTNEGEFVRSPCADGFDIEVVNGVPSRAALADVRSGHWWSSRQW
jgi:hypothetical protein